MKVDRIASLQEFLRSDPNDSFSRYALAMEYAGRGDTQQAASLLEELIQRNPSYIAAYQHLGYLYRQSGQADRASEVLVRGIEVARGGGDLHACDEMQEALDGLTP